MAAHGCRGWQKGSLLAVALTLGACNFGSREQVKQDTAEVEASAQVPDSVEGFLAELAPLPGGAKAVNIDYEVKGETLSGELHTSLGPGGLRRDRWELRTTAGDEFLTTSGTSIANATQLWLGADGEPGELRSSALVGLAKAYLARDADTRAKIIASIRTWHETLDAQRERAGGQLDEVAGKPCLRTRIAAQNVCMWEQARVMLAYEGSAFSITATTIDDAAAFEAKTFELPPMAARATKLEPESTPDYEAMLDELAAGTHDQVATLLYLDLGLPKLEPAKPDPAEPEPEPAKHEPGH